MIVEDFQESDQTILIDFIDLYNNIKINILGEEINPSRGGHKEAA